jgi:hypothetical protein
MGDEEWPDPDAGHSSSDRATGTVAREEADD